MDFQYQYRVGTELAWPSWAELKQVVEILQSFQGRMLNTGVSPRWRREACSSYSQLCHKADTQITEM